MYQFRLLQSTDLPWLARAAAAGVWEAMDPGTKLRSDPNRVARVAAEQVIQGAGGPGGLGIVAEWNHQPVGFLLAGIGPDDPTEAPAAHLLHLWVTPGHRRRGIARKLHEVTEALCRALGVHKVKLWTELSNEPVRGLARSLSYQPEGLIGTKDLSHPF